MGMIDHVPTEYEQVRYQQYSRGELTYHGVLIQDMEDDKLVKMLRGKRSIGSRMWITILSCEMQSRIHKYNSEKTLVT